METRRAAAPLRPIQHFYPPNAQSMQVAAHYRSAFTVKARSSHQVALGVPVGSFVAFEFTVEDPDMDAEFSLRRRETRSTMLGWKGLPLLAWYGMPGTEGSVQSNRHVSQSRSQGSQKVHQSSDVTRPHRFVGGEAAAGRWGPATEECELVFVWDNSYSHVRAKTVSYELMVFLNNLGELRPAQNMTEAASSIRATNAGTLRRRKHG